MGKDEALRLLSDHRTEFARLGVKSLAIFGSFARGDERTDSDVDVLVEFEGPASFGRYMDLKELLETLLRRPVDLVTRKALKPRLKQAIEREAVYVP